MYIVRYQLRVDNVLPATSLRANSRVQRQKNCAEALTNLVSLCIWLVNAGRYFSGYKPVIKERKLPLANFLLFGTEMCIECHQTLPLCEGAGQCQTRSARQTWNSGFVQGNPKFAQISSLRRTYIPWAYTDRMQLKARPNLAPTPADYIAFPVAVLCVHKQLPGYTVANT